MPTTLPTYPSSDRLSDQLSDLQAFDPRFTTLSIPDGSLTSAEVYSVAACEGQLYLAQCQLVAHQGLKDQVAESQVTKDQTAENPITEDQITGEQRSSEGSGAVHTYAARIYRYRWQDHQWDLMLERHLTSHSSKQAIRCQLSAISPTCQKETCQKEARQKANQSEASTSIQLLAHFCGFGNQLLMGLLADADSSSAWVELVSPTSDRALIEAGLYHQGQLYIRALNHETGWSEGFFTERTGEPFARDSLPQASDWQPMALPDQADDQGCITRHITRHITAWISRPEGLYCAIANAESGFELWRWQADSTDRSASWQQTHSKGLGRYSLSSRVTHIAALGEHLYLVTDQEPETAHPARFELLEIYPSGDWDLLSGQPRFTPIGLRVPLLGQGAGFGRATAGPEFLIRHQHRLYLGFQSIEGFQLWVSETGADWQQIDVPQLSQYYQFSRVETASTPYGLAIAGDSQTTPGTAHRQLFLLNLSS